MQVEDLVPQLEPVLQGVRAPFFTAWFSLDFTAWFSLAFTAWFSLDYRKCLLVRSVIIAVSWGSLSAGASLRSDIVHSVVGADHLERFVA